MLVGRISIMTNEPNIAAQVASAFEKIAPLVKSKYHVTVLGIIALIVFGAAIFITLDDSLKIYAGSFVLLLIVFLVCFSITVKGGDLPSKSDDDSENKTDRRLLPNPPRRDQGEQKTFLSAPMASLAGEDYIAMQEGIASIKHSLQKESEQREVYWGGDGAPDPKLWDRPHDAFKYNLQKLRESDNFIIIIPEHSCRPAPDGYCKPSSIWWEAGIALALGKSCTFFVHDDIAVPQRIPYYLRAMENGLTLAPAPPVKFWRFTTIQDILDRIRDAGPDIFSS